MINPAKFIKLSTHISYINASTNIGIIAIPNSNGSTELYLIDSATDKQGAQDILDLLKTKFKNFTLKAILNTHSHADHCGANTYLISQTNCQIWTSKGEAALMKYPEIESGLIWGGTPVHQIRSSYLMAEPCNTDRTFYGEETFTLDCENSTITIQIISLKGHYIDQIGFLIKDTDGKSSFFMGDAISGRNVIRKYWIQYLYDETLTKKTLEKIAKIKADNYIPGHGQLVDNIEGLSELNLLAIMETENLIVEELKTPKTTEELLKILADRNSITLGLANYVLIGATLRSYLSGLYEEKRIDFKIEENKMLWQAL